MQFLTTSRRRALLARALPFRSRMAAGEGAGCQLGQGRAGPSPQGGGRGVSQGSAGGILQGLQLLPHAGSSPGTSKLGSANGDSAAAQPGGRTAHILLARGPRTRRSAELKRHPERGTATGSSSRAGLLTAGRGAVRTPTDGGARRHHALLLRLHSRRGCLQLGRGLVDDPLHCALIQAGKRLLVEAQVAAFRGLLHLVHGHCGVRVLLAQQRQVLFRHGEVVSPPRAGGSERHFCNPCSSPPLP